MLDLEIIPERSLGCDTWEFVLGMHFSQSVAIIQSQVGTIRGVQVLYSDQNPLSVDLVINMPQDGIRLIFDPVAQRLKIIEIYNMKLVKLRYSGMCFNSEEITPSIEQIEHCFGATHPGLYDSQRHLFALNFRGLSFYFPPGYAHGLGSLQFPNGGSPVVSRTTIYYGSQHQSSNTPQAGTGTSVAAPLPSLPLSCVRHQLHLRRATVLRDNHTTQGLRLHMFTQGTSRSLELVQVNVCRVVRFGDSCQSVARALGAPQRLYYKADDKMRIHRASSRRRPPPASDYFFNYFTLGLRLYYKADDKMRIHRGSSRRRPPPASDYFFNYFTLGLADDKMRIHRASSRRRPPPASDYFFNYFTLGLRLYYKADDKMRIHRASSRRRPPPASDYFFNYFTLGLVSK
ncbi:hypothetical protein NE865_08255 [Phthorimaea operculella]|nr:hypothetical protein NE865_08255 [Phthorimaea operculella]